MEKLGSGYLFQLDFFNGFVKFSFLNVDTHGEAELPHISCSCEPKRPFLFLKYGDVAGSYLFAQTC